jgi:plastocyanin domain-containing protein
MEQILVLLGSIVAISLIVWWFFAKPTEDAVTAISDGKLQTINITVSGGYSPNRVMLLRGIPAKLIFTRKDASSCFDEVVLPDFGIKAKLPINKTYEIDIQPDAAGSYHYTCGMHMFSGEIVVK